MAGELLRNSDCNVISVDWSKLSGPSPFYLAAAANARPVGVHAARFLRGTLMDRRVGLRMEGVRAVVGFSLGAQAVGNMGNALDGRLGRISGLDPAGKLFLVFYAYKIVLHTMCQKHRSHVPHCPPLPQADAGLGEIRRRHTRRGEVDRDGRKGIMETKYEIICQIFTSCSGRSR